MCCAAARKSALFSASIGASPRFFAGGFGADADAIYHRPRCQQDNRYAVDQSLFVNCRLCHGGLCRHYDSLPLLLPVAASFGFSALQFGVILVANLTIGAITPPVGCCLFAASVIGERPVERSPGLLSLFNRPADCFNAGMHLPMDVRMASLCLQLKTTS